MKKIKQKKVYAAPELTVLRFRQEQGYAASSGLGLASEYAVTDDTEDRINAGYFGGSSDTWF